MQAIQTYYFGPTPSRNARIKATCHCKHINFSYQHDLSISENHANAAKKLASSLDWKGDLISGELRDSYCHVFNYTKA